MANVLSLALKINADASGLKLDPVSKALRQLGEETDRVSGIFDKFTSTSEAAARAQAATEQALNDLIAARKAGTVTATEFAESFRTVEEAAKRQAAEFQRGADISERYATEEEKRARTLAELEQLLTAGAIKEDVYAKAVADASGATAAAAEAEKQRVAALAEAETGPAHTHCLPKFARQISHDNPRHTARTTIESAIARTTHTHALPV